MNTLAAVLQPFVDKNYIAGAVALAATKDRVLACEAVGYEDLATKKPMTPDSMVWIASQTKPMTATALMMLVDEGKVSIEDPVEKHLPEFRHQKVLAYKDDDVTVLKKPQHPITVREVLNHTAGLNFSTCIESPTLDRLTLRDSVCSHAMLPLESEPGTKYNYSNGGTNTAGRIIEIVSGQAYEDFMDERLFQPLGMRDTTFWPNEEQLARTAKCYMPDAGKTGLVDSRITQLALPYSDRTRKPMPAGGLFATAADCAKFMQMILNGGVVGGRRYISEDSIAEMTRKQTADSVPNEYGLCWGLKEGNVEGRYGHGGACKTFMRIDAKTGLITVFLIQHNGDWPTEEAGAIGAVFEETAAKLLG